MKPVKVNASTLKVRARVRYPEDSYVYDGMIFIEDDNEKPFMPCMETVEQNGRKLFAWCPEIDVKTGVIRNWRKGYKAEVNYKVCDEFQCEILDADGNKVLEYEGYVPKFMDIDETGFGDYIYLTVDENGHIQNWTFNHRHMEELNTYGNYNN
jgi:hypothetical protein